MRAVRRACRGRLHRQASVLGACQLQQEGIEPGLGVAVLQSSKSGLAGCWHHGKLQVTNWKPSGGILVRAGEGEGEEHPAGAPEHQASGMSPAPAAGLFAVSAVLHYNCFPNLVCVGFVLCAASMPSHHCRYPSSQGWPLPPSTEVWVLTSTSGASPMTNADRKVHTSTVR